MVCINPEPHPLAVYEGETDHAREVYCEDKTSKTEEFDMRDELIYGHSIDIQALEAFLSK
jgi:hypothetical protein